MAHNLPDRGRLLWLAGSGDCAVSAVGEIMDYEQIKAIIDVRIKEWNYLIKQADARNADITVTIAFEASVGAARIILQDIEAAYKKPDYSRLEQDLSR